MVFAKAVRNQMVTSFAEWQGKTDNRATTAFGYCPSMASFPVWLHCANARWNRCQEDLNSFPLAEDHSPQTMRMKTIQQELTSDNLSLNEAIYVAQNHPLWRLMSTFGTTLSCWCRQEVNEW